MKPTALDTVSLPWMAVNPSLPAEREYRRYFLTVKPYLPKGWEEPLAWGLLVTLWASVFHQSTTGDLTAWTKEEIADAARWGEQDASAFIGALEAGRYLVDGRLAGWDDGPGRVYAARRSAAERKRQQRERVESGDTPEKKQDAPSPSRDQRVTSHACPVTSQDKAGTSRDVPAKKRGDEMRGEEREPGGSAAAGAADAPAGDLGLEAEDPPPATPTALLAAWNAVRGGLPKALKLTPDRTRASAARLREEPSLAVWEREIRRVAALPHIVAGGWFTVDYLLRPGTLTRVQEGAYDRPHARPAPAQAPRAAVGAHDTPGAAVPLPVPLEGLEPASAEPWASIRRLAQPQVDEREFESVLATLRQAPGSNGTVRLVARSPLHADLARENYLALLREIAENADPDHPVRIEVLTPDEYVAFRAELPTGKAQVAP